MKFFLTHSDAEFVNCPNCQNEIYDAIEVDLRLVFDKGIKNKFNDTVELEFCDRCESVMLPIEELDSWLMFENVEPNQVQDFWIDNEKAQVFLSVSTPSKTMKNIPWEEYRNSIKLEQQRKTQAVPNAAVVKKLEQDEKLEWFLSVQALKYVQENPFSEAKMAYAMIILSNNDELVEQETKLGEFTQADLLVIIRRACAMPAENAVPKRPKTVLVGNPDLLELLSEPLQNLGIGMKQGDPSADQILFKQLNELMGQPEEARFFEHVTDQEIKAFENAARAFFELQPWNFTTPDDCLAFRLANGSWQYATIMGHFNESFGMTMYQNWLGFCKILYNQNGASPQAFDEDFDFEDAISNFMNPLAALEHQGGMESFNACEKFEIPVQDMQRLSKLGVKPVFQNRFPIAQRFDTEGNSVLPTLSITDYTMLLEGLVIGLTSQKNKKTLKLDGQFGSVEIKYPSSGLEQVPQQARYKLEFEIPKFRGLKRKLKVVIHANATERFSKIAREIVKATKTKIKEGIYIQGFHDGHSYLWKHPSTPKLDPSPVVFHCLDTENFAIQFNAVNAKVSISPEPESTLTELVVLVS